MLLHFLTIDLPKKKKVMVYPWSWFKQAWWYSYTRRYTSSFKTIGHLVPEKIYVCVYSNSRNDVPRVAQRYGTIAAHTRRRASVLVVFVVFCVHMHSFAGLIRRTPPPTFGDTAITDRHNDTTIFQLCSEKIFKCFWLIWAWRPCGSCDLNRLNKYLLPQPLEANIFKIVKIWESWVRGQWITLATCTLTAYTTFR